MLKEQPKELKKVCLLYNTLGKSKKKFKEEKTKEVEEEKKAVVSCPTGFPSFDSWKKDLGDWLEPLKCALSMEKFESLYNFVQKEYAFVTVIVYYSFPIGISSCRTYL